MGKRVLIVTNSSWNIQNFRKELINDLHLNGAKVGIVCPGANNLEEEFSQLPLHYFSLEKLGYDLKLFRHLYFFFYFIKVFWLFKPDTVFSYTIKPNLICGFVSLFYGNRFYPVITGLGTSYTSSNGLFRWIKILYKYSFKSANKVVFQNKTDRQLFIDLGLIKKEQATLIYGSGVNTKKFTPPANQSFKSSFLFVGRLLKSKGIEDFYRAAKSLENKSIEFNIIGLYDPSHPDSISSSLFDLLSTSKAVNYLGYREDVRPFIEESTAVVLPTHREGLPKAILEALAMGKPIICSNVPGCQVFFEFDKEMETDSEKNLSKLVVYANHGKDLNYDSLERSTEKGFLNSIGFQIEVSNFNALANKMEDLNQLSDLELKQMGERGRNLVLKYFDVSIINRQYLDLLHEKEN